MTAKPNNLHAIYNDIATRHLTDEDRAALTRDGVPILLQPDAVWPKLHEEASRIMETGDPDSIEAMDLAKRWMEKVFETTSGDPDLTRKVRDLTLALNDDPTFQAASTSSNAMTDFVQRAYAAAIKSGLMDKAKS